jgi:hypothetical protein
MRTMITKNYVVLEHRGTNSHSYTLLTYAQMHWASHFLFGVTLSKRLLNTANA